MSVRDLGTIGQAEVEFAPGLTVLTGETGAGKTMVLHGLGLLLGGRADTTLVRKGAERATVTGEVEVAADHVARELVEDAGGDADDGILLVRSVRSGGSRAHAGGTPVPVSVLTSIGQSLVAIHGQADQWRLRSPEHHREVLDAAGGATVRDAKAAYTEAYARLGRLERELNDLKEATRQRGERLDLLRVGLERIEAVDPQAGEDDDLRVEAERLGHVDDLRTATSEAHEAISGADPDSGVESPGAMGLLGIAERALRSVPAHDPELDDLAARAREVTALANELGSDLASYLSGLDADPARLAFVHERRAALADLRSRYGEDEAAVLEWARQAALEVDRLAGADDRLAELTDEVTHARTEAGEAAGELTAARTEAAARLGAQITDELAHVAMARASITVSVTQEESEQGLPVGGRTLAYGPHGVDAVEILLSSGPGMPAAPVSRAASGGELSRVMLAIEVVTHGGAIPTFVFDEVDAGVGGEVGADIGRRLARLAQTSQVVVVTHLAQVAAYADSHLLVRRDDDDAVSRTDVVELTGEERERELARMLGGRAESGSARAHVRELLDEAERVRADGRATA